MVQLLVCGTRVREFVFSVGTSSSSEEKKIKAFQKNPLNYPASRLTEQRGQMSTEPSGNYCI